MNWALLKRRRKKIEFLFAWDQREFFQVYLHFTHLSISITSNINNVLRPRTALDVYKCIRYGWKMEIVEENTWNFQDEK